MCTVGVERLVGIFVLAVHALDLSEIVVARSMLFAGGWWRIHFTCGSPYILIPTSGFSPDSGARKAAGLGRRKRGCNPLFGSIFSCQKRDMAGSVRRRRGQGQGQRRDSHGQPGRVEEVADFGGCRGRVPMPKPMGRPEMWGQGSKSRPAPPAGEPVNTLKASLPATRPVPRLRQGGGDRSGAGQIRHG